MYRRHSLGPSLLPLTPRPSATPEYATPAITYSPPEDLIRGAVGWGYVAFDIAEPETSLRAWSIVHRGHPGSRAKYRSLIRRLNAVNGDAVMPDAVGTFDANRTASLSERTDLIGEFSTTWITRVNAIPDARGAILLVLTGAVVLAMTISPFAPPTDPTPASALDAIAAMIERRAPEQLMARQVSGDAMMAKLPTLAEVQSIFPESSLQIEVRQDPA